MHSSHGWITPCWPVPRSVKAISTTRYGGQSQPPFDALNLATHVGDEAKDVMSNRHYLKQQCHLPAEPIWLNQVSESAVLGVDQPYTHTTYDASVTRAVNTPCAILTADCLPVLFCHQRGSVIAAAHAGWRGLALGVLENTLDALACDPKEVLVWLGPAIGPDYFEVGDEVRALFVHQDEGHAAHFKALPTQGKWLADIFSLARFRLYKKGVKAIYGGDVCTYENTAYFSYRREGQTGRMATLIWRS